MFTYPQQEGIGVSTTMSCLKFGLCGHGLNRRILNDHSVYLFSRLFFYCLLYNEFIMVVVFWQVVFCPMILPVRQVSSFQNAIYLSLSRLNRVKYFISHRTPSLGAHTYNNLSEILSDCGCNSRVFLDSQVTFKTLKPVRSYSHDWASTIPPITLNPMSCNPNTGPCTRICLDWG